MTPSKDPAGRLQPPGLDAFPPSPPHAVPAYARRRWPASLTRWWRGVFGRNAYGHQPHAQASGTGGHHFFQHLSDPPAHDAPPSPTAGAAAPHAP
jgi:hypothetical protein